MARFKFGFGPKDPGIERVILDAMSKSVTRRLLALSAEMGARKAAADEAEKLALDAMPPTERRLFLLEKKVADQAEQIRCLRVFAAAGPK